MIDRSAVSVTAVRIGRTNLGEANVVLDDEAISVIVRSTVDDHPVRVSFDSVESVVLAGHEVTLSLRDGSRVTLVSPGATKLATDVLTRCRALPELTRALRTLGSRRSMRGRRASAHAEQRQFFAPLLDARRLAASASTPAAAIAAFDQNALSQAFVLALGAFVAERQAEQGPARRALEAELEEIAEPLMAAIQALAEAGLGARAAVDDLKLWRVWAGHLRSTFEVADRVWLSLDVALDAAPLPP